MEGNDVALALRVLKAAGHDQAEVLVREVLGDGSGAATAQAVPQATDRERPQIGHEPPPEFAGVDPNAPVPGGLTLDDVKKMTPEEIAGRYDEVQTVLHASNGGAGPVAA